MQMLVIGLAYCFVCEKDRKVGRVLDFAAVAAAAAATTVASSLVLRRARECFSMTLNRRETYDRFEIKKRLFSYFSRPFHATELGWLKKILVQRKEEKKKITCSRQQCRNKNHIPFGFVLFGLEITF